MYVLYVKYNTNKAVHPAYSSGSNSQMIPESESLLIKSRYKQQLNAQPQKLTNIHYKDFKIENHKHMHTQTCWSSSLGWIIFSTKAMQQIKIANISY